MKPRPLSIHRIILIRLIPAWLILSVIMGGLAYWLESRRVERNVFGLASDAAQHFTPAAEKALLEGSLSDHMHTLRALLNDDQFAGIRLYDQDRNALFAVWGKSDPALEEVMRGTPAAFPGPGDHRHQVVWTGRRMVVRALVSLTDPSRRTFGWFEGIYVVPPRTVESIQSRVRDTILMVLIVTTLTTWTLYPIIVVLNRATVRLSNRMLDSVTELMRVLGSAIAQRDSDTDSHNYRVALYSIRLAENMGRPAPEIAALIAGAFLHDVGKIGIPDTILRKDDKLTAEEYETMKTHVAIGESIIRESQWLARAREVVACHHERFDGAGYPKGLKGDEIPFNARLFNIVDVFDALTSQRAYKTAMPLADTLALMREQSGRQFDPAILAIFEQVAEVNLNYYGEADNARLKANLASAIHIYFPA